MHIRHSLEKTGTVKVKGGSISYRLYEPDDEDACRKTPMIIVHGGPGCSHVMMYNYLYSLADERPVIFYDQLGSYFSPAEVPKELMKIERFAEEINYIMDALELEKILLLGQSWGSAVSTQFTLTYPKKVKGLILSGPHLSTPKWVEDCNELLKKFSNDIQETFKKCEAEGTTNSDEYKKADRVFSERHLCRLKEWPASMAKSAKMNSEYMYRTMWGPSEFTCHGLLSDMDLFPRLSEIDTPALLICGEYDTATPKTIREAQEAMQNATLKVIPDSGHLSYVDSNEEYLKVVNDFLSGTSIKL